VVFVECRGHWALRVKWERTRKERKLYVAVLSQGSNPGKIGKRASYFFSNSTICVNANDSPLSNWSLTEVREASRYHDLRWREIFNSKKKGLAFICVNGVASNPVQGLKVVFRPFDGGRDAIFGGSCGSRSGFRHETLGVVAGSRV